MIALLIAVVSPTITCQVISERVSVCVIETAPEARKEVHEFIGNQPCKSELCKKLYRDWGWRMQCPPKKETC